MTKAADPAAAAVVTGASRGIGKAIARRLAEDGYRMVLVDVLDDVREVAAELVDATAYVTDVRDDHALRQVMAAASPLEVLVNCAGSCHRTSFAEMTPENWRKDVDTNLTATFFACQAAVFPHMRDQRYGRIVNIASVSGKIGGIGPVQRDAAGGRSGPAYAASKAGVINLTRWIAREIGQWGITCNAVAPGPIATEMTEGHSYGLDDMPIPRMGTPTEVADAVAYLAARERGYTTGACLHVDGGLVRA
ncbi:MAG: SDR family oxidoreductase [Streptosporangiales bacterium]|nr:SDR family oxidoreductase [Streptosporangiales bacterium]